MMLYPPLNPTHRSIISDDDASLSESPTKGRSPVISTVVAANVSDDDASLSESPTKGRSPVISTVVAANVQSEGYRNKA